MSLYRKVLEGAPAEHRRFGTLRVGGIVTVQEGEPYADGEFLWLGEPTDKEVEEFLAPPEVEELSEPEGLPEVTVAVDGEEIPGTVETGWPQDLPPNVRRAIEEHELTPEIVLEVGIDGLVGKKFIGETTAEHLVQIASGNGFEFDKEEAI